MHHGIKGMKWGVRRFEDANGHLTPAGKRRYAVQDARKYYKINRLQRAQEKNRDPDRNEHLSKRIRRVQTRSDRKHANLNQRDINIGRQIVAKNRRNWAMAGTAAKAAATAAGAYALYQNPKTRALVPAALVAGGAATLGSAKKVPYYTMEARRYKQVNPKGATNKGLTKRQKALRKAGKAAVGAALAGATGYALYKTGAGKAAIKAGKNALASRTINTNAQNDISDSSSKKRRTIKDTISDARSAAKAKTSSHIRNKIMVDVDDSDPRTWGTAVRNAKKVVSDAKRYGRAANKLRKGDKIGAATEVSDEISNTTNKIITGTQQRITKHKKHKK